MYIHILKHPLAKKRISNIELFLAPHGPSCFFVESLFSDEKLLVPGPDEDYECNQIRGILRTIAGLDYGVFAEFPALARLTHGQFQVLLLRDGCKCKYKDIASVVGRSASTVRSQHSRAKKKLAPCASAVRTTV
jgi:DNA-binding CsgD family transcriptional regulator